MSTTEATLALPLSRRAARRWSRLADGLFRPLLCAIADWPHVTDKVSATASLKRNHRRSRIAV